MSTGWGEGPQPPSVSTVPLLGTWGLGPSWASAWTEQHIHWALLGPPLTERKGVHLSPVRDSSCSSGRGSHPGVLQMPWPGGRENGSQVCDGWGARVPGAARTHLTILSPLLSIVSSNPSDIGKEEGPLPLEG